MQDPALRLQVEEFLFAEADLLDRWALAEWIQLFTQDCRYEVPSTDLDAAASADSALFLIADDWHRLNQRTIRLSKKAAHAEYPRSKIVHNISNVRILGRRDDEVQVACNFATFRTSKTVTATYVGQHRYLLKVSAEGLRIKEKRTTLALDGLRPHGRISMIV